MRLALVGYGRMGRAVEDQARLAGHEITARISRADLGAGTEELSGLIGSADVAIDFSAGARVADTIAAAEAARVDLVIGTTGLDGKAAEALAEVRDVGVVHGPNFSLGVHMFLRLVREAARLADADGGYDVHLLDMHHRHKRDHPSGTAIRTAEAVLAEVGDKVRWEQGPPRGVADPAVLYVTSVRSGEIPGTHTVALEGDHDRLEVRHEARDRRGFAQGALRAAEWIRGRRGVFRFEDVVDDLFGAANKLQEVE